MRVIATPNGTAHSLVVRYNDLNRNQAYRITVWVKPVAGGNVELAALDQPDGTPVNNASVFFDLSSKTVSAASGTKGRGIDQGPDNWQKVWLELPTTNGQFLVAIRPAKEGTNTYQADGRLGFILGGFQLAPAGR
jgi:hypothetical protein